jgi:hypothetical protein
VWGRCSDHLPLFSKAGDSDGGGRAEGTRHQAGMVRGRCDSRLPLFSKASDDDRGAHVVGTRRGWHDNSEESGDGARWI